MTRLILVDPWINDTGGHNFQYAIDILRAAEAIGRDSVLAVNKQFKPLAPTSRCEVISAFDFQPCHRYWLGPDGRLRHPLDVRGERLDAVGPRAGAAQRLATRLRRACDVHRGDRRRKLAQYATDCQSLFGRIGFQPDDQVFFPSLSEFDFLGLVAYLDATPATRAVAWHLQFHFDIFQGRQHEYDGQPERLSRFRRQFSAAIRRVARHRVHFYCTTEQIAEQYNRMQVAPFQPLPYPVSQDLQPAATRIGGGPLRVTCAGAVRREKGRVTLARLIHEILRGRLADGRMQLVFQANRNALRRLMPRDMARRLPIHDTPDVSIADPIVPVAFPLHADAYARLIRQAEIGLLLYDSRRYHARCSGVLSEMLAAGVPALVPAGCWLADQQAGPLGDYVDQWLRSAPSSAHTGSDVELAVDVGTLAIALRVGGLGPPAATEYVELRARQFDRDHREVRAGRKEILSRTPRTDRAAAVLPVHPMARTVRLAVRRAYEHSPLDRPVWDVATIGSLAAHDVQPARLGGIGLTTSTADDIAEKLEEIVANYEQYREAAIAFSRRWRHDHAARRTLEVLAANSVKTSKTRVA